MSAARRWAPLAGALVAVLATVLTLLGAPAAGAATAPSPSPSAKAGRVLPIDIRLGRVQVGVTLPLTLDGLLGRTSTGAAPPTTATPVPSSSKPYPPTLPSTAPTPTASGAGAHATDQAAGTGANPARRTTAVPPSAGRVAHRGASRRPSAKPSTAHPTPTKKRAPAMVFVRGVVPNSTPAFLIVLCVACAVGVAFVVKLSGGRRRL